MIIDNQTEPTTIKEHNFLPLLPLKNVVILPKSIIPIIVGRQSSIQAVEYALKHDRTIFITAQHNSAIENPTEQDVYKYGTKSTILQVMRMPNDALKILAEGISRARILKTEPTDGFLGAWCEDLPTTNMSKTVALEATWRQLQALYAAYAKLNEKAPADLAIVAKNVHDMDYITDTIAVHITNLSFDDRQKVLEITDLKKRMVTLCAMLKNEIEILQTENRIRGRIQTQVEKNQREYYLTEQIKAIQKELGREDQSAELEAIKSKLKTLSLSKEALEKVERELKRLEQMPPLSSEAVVSRNYIDWIISIPWKKISEDTIGLTEAETMLQESHAGLKKAKERIIEFLAAKKFSKNLDKSPIICLVGPPGVGKTSLGKSIAESLGSNFVRISLGGIRDEAEIRGHRRTYIGAMPGKIVQAMRKAGTVNPVILLDEIDKMSRDMHGDPSAALLEVLDPEQNKSFVDHFLDVEYDLSKVMFIATANMIDGIPYALYDRLEIINLSGYTEDEKIDIAEKFLIPKNLKTYGLTKQKFKITSDIIRTVVANYTKEAGVRQLERVITKLMRKSIQVLLKEKSVKSVTITDAKIKEWLGHPTFRKTSLSTNQNKIGIATGLAWTEIGGDVLEIETTVISGKGGLTLTGQLGEVMQESAHAALSYIRSRAADIGLKSSFYTTKDIHIHIPEGATPKDGPSAGITMCTALVSALTNNPIRNDFAMTGEITLQGRVLAVGGLKEKILAAKQHNFKTVIVPQENYDDVQEILKEIEIGGLQLMYVSSMDEVLKAAFVKNPFDKTTIKAAKATDDNQHKKPTKKKAKPAKKKKN
ncbi:MAG: endopeptidase La [Candidatus Dependentiae bacterium]|nr:endopeptidase La [Candidatus Dependentiae bacterium]